jgi:hypothetical protein
VVIHARLEPPCSSDVEEDRTMDEVKALAACPGTRLTHCYAEPCPSS